MGRKSRLKIIKRQEMVTSRGKGTKKKVLKTLVYIVLTAGIATGGYYGYTALSTRKAEKAKAATEAAKPTIDAGDIQINGGNTDGLTVTPLDPETGQPAAESPAVEIKATPVTPE